VTILIVVSPSVHSFVWAFIVPFTVKTDMISLFSRLRPNQFTTVQSYPLISIQADTRIIGSILAAGKNSKIAITRSCHPVLVRSADIHEYATYTYPNQSSIFHFHSIQPLHNHSISSPVRYSCVQHYIILFRTMLVSFGAQAERKTIPVLSVPYAKAYSIPVHYDSRLATS